MIEDVNAIFEAIDRLNADQLAKVRAYVDRRMGITPPQIAEDAQTKIAALHKAVENFWEGMSEAEIDAVVEDMNSEYVEPIGSQYDWLDHEDNL